MAMNAKKKQKKLEKKNKKRKLRKKTIGAGLRLRDKASSYAKFPFHECLVPNGIFETGLGNVMVTRRTSDGSIAISAFIVDVYCLGVKNALFSVSNEHDYEHKIKSRIIETHEDQQFENVHPACARKLIEGAILYAKELGFYPHRDYKDAKGIFGDIDSNACPIMYTYGNEGKPFYIRGPNESIVQAERIVDKLNKRCGEGNYDYLMALDEGMIE